MSDSDSDMDVIRDDDEKPELTNKLDTNENLSALRENIHRKGKNSYYYAHGNKIDGPEWDGKEEPRKIGSLSVSEVESTQPKLVMDTITEYSWSDEDNYIKIYIDQSSADSINDSNIVLTNTTSSVDFSYKNDGKEYKLSVPALYDTIESASYKKKSSKFVLALKKITDTTWTSLKAAN